MPNYVGSSWSLNDHISECFDQAWSKGRRFHFFSISLPRAVHKILTIGWLSFIHVYFVFITPGGIPLHFIDFSRMQSGLSLSNMNVADHFPRSLFSRWLSRNQTYNYVWVYTRKWNFDLFFSDSYVRVRTSRNVVFISFTIQRPRNLVWQRPWNSRVYCRGSCLLA